MEGSAPKRRRFFSSSSEEDEIFMDTGAAQTSLQIFQDVTINLLPREIMSEIFQYLDFHDLKSVILVCQYWRELGEDPFLWRKFCLDPAKVFQENFAYQAQFQCNSDELTKLMNIPRLAMMEHLEINPKSVKKLKEEIFVSILNSNLSSINIGYKTQLSNISPKTMSNVLNIMKSVTLKAKLTNKQLEEFFEQSEDSQLETLELCYNNFSKVSSPKLPQLLAKLTHLSLFSVQISAAPAEVMFQQISKNNSMESLSFKNVDLYQVNSEILSNALVNLKHLSLQNCLLDRKQVKEMLTKLVEGNSLTSLDLSGNDLSYASANMLATVVINLETARLREAHLNIEQIQNIFQLVDKSSSLKHLAIANNEDLKRVSNELKYKVGKLLVSVDFQYDNEKESAPADSLQIPVKAVKKDPLACNRCRFKGKTERGLKAHMAKNYCIARNCACLHNVFRNRGSR